MPGRVSYSTGRRVACEKAKRGRPPLESPRSRCHHQVNLARVVTIGCAALVAVVLAACGGQKTTEGGQEVVTVTVTNEEPTTEPTTTDEFEDAPEAEDPYGEDTTTEETSSAASQAAVGESASDDGVAFKVTKLAKVKSLPRPYDSPIRAPKGADLWEAVVVAKNNTDRGVDPFCGGSSAVLIDADQRNFEPHQDSLSIKGNNEGYCGGNIQPGFKATVRLAFTTPKGTDVSGIALWNGDFNNETDPFGDTYVVFSLS